MKAHPEAGAGPGTSLKKHAARKAMLAVCGVVAVALGAIGIFIPLLPTTPFLLLAAACFLRSSRRLYNWLLAHRWFGRYIRQYREHHAISRRARLATLTLLWGTLAFSGLVALDAAWARILLLAIGVGVSLHLLGMKTLE